MNTEALLATKARRAFLVQVIGFNKGITKQFKK